MSTIQRSATLLVLASLLAGCGSGGSQEEDQPPPPRRQDTAQQEMFRPIEKARAVEDTTMQHKRDMDRAIDANEGSSDK